MNDIFDLNKLATGVDTGQTQTIDRVELWVDDNVYYRYPIVTQTQWDAMTGRILKAKCSFGNQDICQAIYLRVVGLTQAAGEIQGASLDPAVELGDTVIADGSAIYAGIIDSTLNDRNESTIKDVSEGDLEQDYDYESSILLQTQRNGVTLERTAEALIAEVTRAEEAEEQLSARIEVNAEGIATKVEKNGVISAINQSAESVTIDADKINLQGYVTVTDLQTEGSTVINGGNITTGEISADRINGGTLKLGGANNGDGVLEMYDADGNMIGRWYNERLLIRDDTELDYKSGKLAVIRKGAADSTPFGAFIGSTQLLGAYYPDQYPNEAEPYIYLNGTTDGSNSSGSTLILPTPQDRGTIITRTGGLVLASSKAYYWGRVMQVTLTLTATGTYAANSTIFSGTINSNYKPIAVATTGGFYINGGGYMGRIGTDGTIVIKTVNSVTFTSGTQVNVSFTYLY